MTRNRYMMQTKNRQSYRPSSREQVNDLIEQGLAEWAFTDGYEDSDTVVHYADWREE